MEQGICKLSIVPVRGEPRSASEMVTQLLFGEMYEVQGREGEWIRIKTTNESYEGWINETQYLSLEDDHFNPITLSTFPFLKAVKQIDKTELYLLPGSLLHQFSRQGNEVTFRINNQIYHAELPEQEQRLLSLNLLSHYARQFRNSPYLWGGRSMWGIDCSGFTQLLYSVCGIRIPRDAWQQALEGEDVAFLNEAIVGDLAFFENKEGKITHVGMVLEKGEIIHASGKVRIDILDSYGIYHTNRGMHTHKLRAIKRYIPKTI